jgi:hypothetical protein
MGFLDACIVIIVVDINDFGLALMLQPGQEGNGLNRLSLPNYQK